MTIYKLSDIVSHARKNSEFYADLYQDLPERVTQVNELPLIDQKKFWKAFRIGGDKLLTGPLEDGIVFKSGGTSGNPKYSVFTSDEWQTFTAAFGRGMVEGGLTAGEQLANIFYVGDLYASFLFIKDSIDNAPVKVMHYPLGGGTSIDKIVKTLVKFDIDSIAGVPTSFIKIAEYVRDNKLQDKVRLKKMLYGGEKLFPDQQEMINDIMPEVSIQSIGYASVDAGLLGYIDDSCGPSEHRVYEMETIVELVDADSGEVITETGKEGKLIVTSLTRKLMPIIRYPAGDCAEWIDKAGTRNRKFLLKGRSEEGARVGPMTIYLDDIRSVLSVFKSKIPYSAFQLVITHFDKMDHLELVIASNISSKAAKSAVSDLTELIYSQRSMFKDLIAEKVVHPIKVTVLSSEKLQVNERTGKLKSIIDDR